MTAQDRDRWDRRYADRDPAPDHHVGLPAPLDAYTDLFPASGIALDVACGGGVTAVWLAQHGLTTTGIDISPIAIEQARELARRNAVEVTFDTVDLDAGLPPGPAADVVVCLRFRDARLDRAIVERLAPGGILATSALSEVGGTVGNHRAKPGELLTAFADLEVIASGEGDGTAWLLARKPSAA